MTDLKLGTFVEIVGKGLKGSVSYFGSTSFAQGKWVGVTLEEALGKNDGEVQGKRYFQCDANHGVFVRPQQVQVIDRKMSGEPAVASKIGRESRLKSPSRPSKMQAPSKRMSLAPSRQGSSLVPPSGYNRRSLPNIKPQASLSSSFAPKQSKLVEEAKEEEVEEEEEEIKEEEKIEEEIKEVTEVVDSSKSLSTAYNVLAPGMSMLDYETLKAHLKDMKEKYETIRLKRQEDRVKLKEAEKMRIQIDQLNEMKNRSSKQIQELSKQLREAKKAMEEAIEAKEKYMDDMTDYHENLEIALLDKEVAEEKNEMLQQENEAFKDRVEELETDLEIIKAEIEDGGNEGAATNYQIKQLEEQNSKLKEALIKMKDLSAAEKSQSQKLQKELEEKTKSLEGMTNKKKKLAEQLQQAEELQDELKEQVDASLAAEEVVEHLTEKNLDLEERITDLQEQVQDLEAMNEMNEELQENARESELELREECDLLRAKVHEADRATQAAHDAVNDHVETISKFRQLVTDLQEANQELQRNQSSDEKKQEEIVPAYNYHIKMVETKATARMVDSELLKKNIEESKHHIEMLSLFLPSTFMRRGGDSDCVLIVLLIKRLSYKCEILANHVALKYDVSASYDKGDYLLGIKGDQLTFAAKFIYDLSIFRHLLNQYNEALNKCEVDLLQKMGTLYSEMEPHDRMLDVFFNQIRKDSFDETISTQALKKSIEYFQNVFQVHLSMIEYDCLEKMRRHCDQLDLLLSSVSISNTRLRSFLQQGQETSDMAILLKDISTLYGDIHSLNKKAKRKLPTSEYQTLEFDETMKRKVDFNVEHLKQIEVLLRKWCVACSEVNAESVQIPTHKMSEILRKNFKEIFGDKSPLEFIRLELGNIVASINGIVNSLQEGELDKVLLSNKIVAPITKRAVQVKAELNDCEDLMIKISERDKFIIDLKNKIKLQSDDIKGANLRSAVFEKKMTKSSNEYKEKVGLLQQQLDSLSEDRKKKEREFEETLDAMQNDIDQLENEKAELKERLQTQSKRSTFTDLMMRSSNLNSAPKSTDSISLASSGKVTDSPLLKQQIQSLQWELKRQSVEKNKLLAEKMIKELDSLPPLDVSALVKKTPSPEMQKILSEAKRLEDQVMKFSMRLVIDITKSNTGSLSPFEQIKSRELHEADLKSKIDNLLIRSQRVMSKEERGCHLQADFTTFPSKSFTQKMKSSKLDLVGKLYLNQPLGLNSNKLLLNSSQYQQLNDIIINLQK